MGFISIKSPPLLPRQDTFVHLYIQWYRIFRFVSVRGRSFIFTGAGWGRIKNYHLAFGIQAQLEC